MENSKLKTKNIKKRLDELKLSHNFCPVPFSTIITEPTGSVGSCRIKGTDFSIGNLNDNSLEDIWNGEKIREWRREFLSGDVKICEKFIKERACNLCSENNKLLDHIELSEYQTTPIKKFTANFNGFCNLECQMCHIWQMPNGFYDKNNFWEKATKEIFPFVLEMDLLSGEPFLQQDTYRLIKTVNEINPDCWWTFTTNANYRLSKKIKDHLNLIKVKNLIISIDSLNHETFSKIRKKGDLDLVLSTVDEYKKYNQERINNGLSDLDMTIHFVVQKDNWKEVSHLIDFCKKNSFRSNIIFLHEPVEFSLETYSEEKIEEILDFYFQTWERDHYEQGIRAITPLLNKLSGLKKVNYLLKIKKELSMLNK